MAINNQNQMGKLSRPELWQTPVSQKNPVNVSQPERLVSVVGGAALTIYGLNKPGPVAWALSAVGAELIYRGATGHCFLYQAFKINTTRKGGNPNATLSASRAIKVKRSLTINKSPEELFRFWRNFENLPRLMNHVQSVKVLDNTHSHWVAKAPGNTSVEWDAEIFNEKENELIAWRSLPGATVPNAGTVQFKKAPGNQGTEVRVEIDYQPPAGVIGAVFAKIFGEEPNQTVQEDLRHLKQMMEAGEIPSTKGQPSCR